jgi:hypothetical protein
MRRVGCTYRRHMKGIYFDHHERDDVQAYRVKFLKQINEYLTMTYNYFSLPARQAALLCFDGTIEIADLEEARLFRKSAGQDSQEVHGAIAITDVLERVRCTGEGTADGSQFDSMVLCNGRSTTLTANFTPAMALSNYFQKWWRKITRGAACTGC